MIAELGHLALVVALLAAIAQTVAAGVGADRGWSDFMALGARAASAQFALIALSFAALTIAFVTSDFSVALTAQHSHSEKPLIYKISGVWGNHEGSMLLWLLILALFGAAISWFGRGLPATLKAWTLSVQGALGVLFIAFTLFTSNPFARAAVAPFEGSDLNPVLQDPGLAFHPPFLYLGYVGLSTVFSFAVAALIDGRVDGAWGRWVRPWTLAAWVFLTIGIALGSYWAYYELGWGGWWFWDPVENASFMPWLAAAALFHSAIVVEKRGELKSWTILLAIVAFALAVMGTFIVRSGLLTSVHAFASDPERGVFILGILLLTAGFALLLYTARAGAFEETGLSESTLRRIGFGVGGAIGGWAGYLVWTAFGQEAAYIVGLIAIGVIGWLAGQVMTMRKAPGLVSHGLFAPVSRESALLFNNVILTVATAAVLVGTLAPLIYEAFGQTITVGPPYFDWVFGGLMVILMLVLPVGAMLPWKRGDARRAATVLGAVGAIALTALAFWLVTLLVAPEATVLAPFGAALSFWVIGGAVYDVLKRVRLFDLGPAVAARRLLSLPRAEWGKFFGHLGIGVMAFGIALSVALEDERITLANDGDRVALGGYEFVFQGVTSQRGPNYQAMVAQVDVFRGGEKVDTLFPERRYFSSQRIWTSEVALSESITRDLYAVLGEPRRENGEITAWALRLYTKPFIAWIWLGSLAMALGGALSLADRRCRVGAPAARRSDAQPATPIATPAE